MNTELVPSATGGSLWHTRESTRFQQILQELTEQPNAIVYQDVAPARAAASAAAQAFDALVRMDQDVGSAQERLIGNVYTQTSRWPEAHASAPTPPRGPHILAGSGSAMQPASHGAGPTSRQTDAMRRSVNHSGLSSNPEIDDFLNASADGRRMQALMADLSIKVQTRSAAFTVAMNVFRTASNLYSKLTQG